MCYGFQVCNCSFELPDNSGNYAEAKLYIGLFSLDVEGTTVNGWLSMTAVIIARGGNQLQGPLDRKCAGVWCGSGFKQDVRGSRLRSIAFISAYCTRTGTVDTSAGDSCIPW